MNNFVEEQKKAVEDDATFTLYKFSNSVTLVYDDVPLRDVKEFTDYAPDGMTALYDAIGIAVATKKKKTKSAGVVCVILTDGQNNASREYNAASIKSLINEMESENDWTFLYLGANQDSFEAGGNIGIAGTRCANFGATPVGLATMTSTASAAVRNYRMSSQTDTATQLDMTVLMPN